jgi:hypothetical protein
MSRKPGRAADVRDVPRRPGRAGRVAVSREPAASISITRLREDQQGALRPGNQRRISDTIREYYRVDPHQVLPEEHHAAALVDLVEQIKLCIANKTGTASKLH